MGNHLVKGNQLAKTQTRSSFSKRINYLIINQLKCKQVDKLISQLISYKVNQLINMFKIEILTF